MLYANPAFASLLGLSPRKVAGMRAEDVFPAAVIGELMKVPDASQEWRDRNGRIHALLSFKVRGGIGVTAQPAGPGTESGVWKAVALLDEVIADFREGEIAPALRAVRAALVPVPKAHLFVGAGELLSRLLTQRSARISGLGVAITPRQDQDAHIPADAAAELIGGVLDHCLAELQVRPLPRALRIAVTTEADGAVTVKVTHNGVQQTHRGIASDAARWGVRFAPASPGPGLGVTYALTFPSTI
jgi:hypothetical protein